MHGAIIADTFRVPWVPISTRPSINTFKWLDWSESMGLEYRPTNLYWRRFSVDEAAKNSVLHSSALAFVKHRLKWILNSIEPSLSRENILEQKEEALLSQLDRFRCDWRGGAFN
jgi:hypothetical protein